MDAESIAEWWRLAYSTDEVPEGFLRLVDKFKSRKSVVSPQPFTIGDLTMCSFLYDFGKAVSKKGGKPKEEAKDEE